VILFINSVDFTERFYKKDDKRKPETTAAAAIYLAGKMMDDKKTQREVANATRVLEVTIRKRSREIEKAVQSD
jgi:transcription initiation factor TFIIIB Brf1 subunit/transcription initiation factor TFIIB